MFLELRLVLRDPGITAMTNISPRTLFYLSCAMPYVALCTGVFWARSMTGGHGYDALATFLLGMIAAGAFGLLNVVVGAILVWRERRGTGRAGWVLKAAWAAGGLLPVALFAAFVLMLRT